MRFRIHILFVIFSVLFIEKIHAKNKILKILKKGKVALINQGKSSGVSKGAKICFSKDGEKIACGKVIKVKKTKSYILFKKKQVRALKKNNFLKDFSSFTFQIDQVGKKKKAPEEEVSDSLRIGLAPVLASMTQANSAMVTYDGANSAETSSLWKESKASGLQFSSFFGEYEMTSSNLFFGFQYLMYTEMVIESDYRKGMGNLFAENKGSGSEIKLYGNYIYFRTAGLSLSAGLNLNISSYNFTAIHKDDSDSSVEKTIIKAKAGAMIIGLYLPLRYDYYITNSIGANLGFDLSIPLVAMSKKVEVSESDATDPNNDSLNLDFEGHFLEQYIYDKNSFALSFNIGLSYRL